MDEREYASCFAAYLVELSMQEAEPRFRCLPVPPLHPIRDFFKGRGDLSSRINHPAVFFSFAWKAS